MIRAFIFVCLACCCLSFSAHAYHPFTEPLRLVTGNKYAPFADRRLESGGMITEIVTVAFQLMGRTAKIHFLPWRRAFMGVEQGIYSATFPHFYTEELAQSFYYSQPLYPIRQRIYVSINRQLEINHLNDLSGHRLCAPIGYVLDERLQKLIDTATISIISPASIEICAQMLDRGRVDFMVLDETVYMYMFSNKFQLKAVGQALESTGMFLLFPKNNPDSLGLLWEFNAGLQSIQECGIFDRIIHHHLRDKEMIHYTPPPTIYENL
jgi:polar amino acid transport system substrate-binding protein